MNELMPNEVFCDLKHHEQVVTTHRLFHVVKYHPSFTKYPAFKVASVTITLPVSLINDV